MGDFIRRIWLGVNRLFFGWIKDASTPGAHPERDALGEGIRDYFKFGLDDYIAEVDRWKGAGVDVRPDTAWTEAITLSNLAVDSWRNITQFGIFMEALSAGQIEEVGKVGRDYFNMLGISNALGMWLKDPVEIGVRIPNKYYLNSLFKPMIPGIADQIRFAVREAYPGVTLEDTPSELEKWIGYLGYSKFWTDAYWTAHWMIPTLEQSRDLYWRNVITLEEYKKMIRLADYHPDYESYWLELAWKYPGRIDQRWLYEWNLIDKLQLEEFVRAEGIHPDWQVKVAEAYAKNILRDEIGRVRTQLITLYREGFRTKTELQNELNGLGYRSEVIDWSIREADLRLEREDKMDYLKIYESQLSHGTITEETFIANCKGIGMTNEAINRKIALINAKKGA